MTTNEQAGYTPTLEELRGLWAEFRLRASGDTSSTAVLEAWAEFDRAVSGERHRVAEQCAQVAERWINAMAGSSSPDEAAWPGYWEAKRWVADNVPDEIRAAFPASNGPELIDRTQERSCPVCFMADLDQGNDPAVMARWEDYHDAHCSGRWHDEGATQ